MAEFILLRCSDTTVTASTLNTWFAPQNLTFVYDVYQGFPVIRMSGAGCEAASQEVCNFLGSCEIAVRDPMTDRPVGQMAPTGATAADRLASWFESTILEFPVFFGLEDAPAAAAAAEEAPPLLPAASRGATPQEVEDEMLREAIAASLHVAVRPAPREEGADGKFDPIDVTAIADILQEDSGRVLRFLNRRYRTSSVLGVRGDGTVHMFHVSWMNASDVRLYREFLRGYVERPDSLLEEVAARYAETVRIYIDVSNINGALDADLNQPNSTYHERLIEVVEDGREAKSRFVGASVLPEDVESATNMWRERGYKSTVLPREVHGKEVAVDECIHAAIAMDISKQFVRKPRLVLLTGDGNDNGGRVSSFPEVVQQALVAGWCVEVWSSRRLCNRRWFDFATNYGTQFSLHFFDEHISYIVMRRATPVTYPYDHALMLAARGAGRVAPTIHGGARTHRSPSPSSKGVGAPKKGRAGSSSPHHRGRESQPGQVGTPGAPAVRLISPAQLEAMRRAAMEQVAPKHVHGGRGGRGSRGRSVPGVHEKKPSRDQSAQQRVSPTPPVGPQPPVTVPTQPVIFHLPEGVGKGGFSPRAPAPQAHDAATPRGHPQAPPTIFYLPQGAVDGTAGRDGHVVGARRVPPPPPTGPPPPQAQVSRPPPILFHMPHGADAAPRAPPVAPVAPPAQGAPHPAPAVAKPRPAPPTMYHLP